MAPEEIPTDRALSRFLDSEPEPEDGPAKLAKAMTEDSRFAAEVHRLLTIDGLLYQAADADPAAFAESMELGHLAAEDDGVQFTQAISARLQVVAPISGGRRKRLSWTAAAAACVAAASFGWLWLGNESNPAQADLPVAVLVNEANAHFAANASPAGVNFAPGSYQLEAGTVHLRFASGAEVVMRYHLRYTIIDKKNMALNEELCVRWCRVPRTVLPFMPRIFATKTLERSLAWRSVDNWARANSTFLRGALT